MEKTRLVVVIPVFNDWSSVSILIPKIVQELPEESVHLILIDDGSTVNASEAELSNLPVPVEVVRLRRNLGHQKAIALGLAYAVCEKEFDFAVFMDSDGEDKPEDILPMLEHARQSGDKIVFAHRAKRKEGFIFQSFYRVYKMVFRWLTGVAISFGNFCIVPFQVADRVAYVSEIWNHFSGGIIKSRLPYELHPTERGKRYVGVSKMNLQSLILHGLSSVSVHIDTVSVRLLLASLILLCVSVAAILVVTGIRLFTDLAIPGWTSNIVLGLSLVFLQALFLSVLLVFIILSYRTQKHFIPATDYKTFIRRIDKLS